MWEPISIAYQAGSTRRYLGTPIGEGTNAFDAKVDIALMAMDDLNDRNDVSALNAMRALCANLNAQRSRGPRNQRLTDEQADELAEGANAVINAIDGSAAP